MFKLFGLFKKKKTIFEDQLNQLSELGIFMRVGLKKELLLEETSRSEYEEDPYNLLLLTLGGEVEVNGEFINVSHEIWYLDAECIEDHEDYARVIMRLGNKTKLKLNKITDYIDIQNSTAWVSFEYKNELIRWEMKVEDDWLDMDIFRRFNELTKTEQSMKLYISNLDQGCLVGYFNQEQVIELNELTKYKFEEY
ncbi:hypothetical protein [Paenibacillus polymyxa]|uniref:hypothetical protein n=2 Tax=Paenibacillus polymyxa TaxID=1406 RepID=UPI001FD42597|nr:hypothetical protein [Paenibacillus polymyxa]MDU8672244.1 hypothetical protein [Paenibacillus polymyxa]URJ35022.1 hypothetical protein MF625_004345 [Paenibacillus polymyxa]URJ56331.1 hypothetical protein MF623_000980 [Paenibacillus polymyxa]URJ63761.1 hypothetical protein MF620_003364 [Paenibacillus polymyxa]URJ70842.1 hypothetical protein MF624_000973 [Paenibacillus polymyxa]